MQDPILKELRSIRARYSLKRRNGAREVYESQQLLEKVCDLVVLPNGERRYIASKQKMYDYFIAPRVAKQKRLAAEAQRRDEEKSSS
jgi:hypothetical protein